MEADAQGCYERIRLLVRRRRGVDLAHYRRSYVQRRIQTRMRARRTADLAAYVHLLSGDPGEGDRLLESLSTKVTSFFRNPGLFAYLQRRILPDLFDASPGHTLRLWSAACATGEEAWSLAATAALISRPGEDRFRVVGTDIDREAVAAARRGVYPTSALRSVPSEIQRRFFAPTQPAGLVRIASDLAEAVRFRVEDLAQTPAAGAFDVVLCRNVLIYFDAALQQRVLLHLSRALRPGGWLALGRVERVVGEARAAFEVVNLKERVYRRI